MKTFSIALLLAASSAHAQCPDLSGVYYTRMPDESNAVAIDERWMKLVYALFTQTGCEKLHIQLLTEQGPEVYFSVPVIGSMDFKTDGATRFRAYWNDGQLVSELESPQFPKYKITLTRTERELVQIREYDMKDEDGTVSSAFEDTRWIPVK